MLWKRLGEVELSADLTNNNVFSLASQALKKRARLIVSYSCLFGLLRGVDGVILMVGKGVGRV